MSAYVTESVLSWIISIRGACCTPYRCWWICMFLVWVGANPSSSELPPLLKHTHTHVHRNQFMKDSKWDSRFMANFFPHHSSLFSSSGLHWVESLLELKGSHWAPNDTKQHKVIPLRKFDGATMSLHLTSWFSITLFLRAFTGIQRKVYKKAFFRSISGGALDSSKSQYANERWARRRHQWKKRLFCFPVTLKRLWLLTAVHVTISISRR